GRGSGGIVVTAIGGLAGVGRCALADRFDRDPSRLLRVIDRELPHRRSWSGVSNRPWLCSTDDGGCHRGFYRRAIEFHWMEWDFCTGGGGVSAVGRRRPRVQTNRSARRRLCVFHRADNLCVLCRGWHRCAAFRQSQCLFALVVCWYRGRDGALRTIPRRSQGAPRNASLVAARFCRRRLATPF